MYMEELSNRRLLPIDMASYAGVRGGPVGRLSRRRHRNNRKYGASKLRFLQAKEFLQKLSATRACALKSVRRPCYRSQNFREYQF